MQDDHRPVVAAQSLPEAETERSKSVSTVVWGEISG
jgi:hypothetical protein